MIQARLAPGRKTYQRRGRTYESGTVYTVTNPEEAKFLASCSAFIVTEIPEVRVPARAQPKAAAPAPVKKEEEPVPEKPVAAEIDDPHAESEVEEPEKGAAKPEKKKHR